MYFARKDAFIGIPGLFHSQKPYSISYTEQINKKYFFVECFFSRDKICFFAGKFFHSRVHAGPVCLTT